LQLQEDLYPAIKVLLAVGCVPAIQDQAQFPLRVPNRNSCPRSPDPQVFDGTETLGDLRLDPLARTSRISYPAGWNVSSELKVATNNGTCT
jgi:hypothetical protein